MSWLSITSSIGTLLIFKDRVYNYIKSWIPSYVSEIDEFSISDDTVKTLYKAKYSFINYINSININIEPNNYYLIRTWNNNDQKSHTYYISGNTMKEMIGLNDMSNIWALSHHGIVTLLQKYITKTVKTPNILSILYKDIDITFTFRNILNSLNIPKNIHADALFSYYKFVNKTVDNKKEDENTFKIVNFDLDEYECKGSQYVI